MTLVYFDKSDLAIVKLNFNVKDIIYNLLKNNRWPKTKNLFEKKILPTDPTKEMKKKKEKEDLVENSTHSLGPQLSNLFMLNF